MAIMTLSPLYLPNRMAGLGSRFLPLFVATSHHPITGYIFFCTGYIFIWFRLIRAPVYSCLSFSFSFASVLHLSRRSFRCWFVRLKLERVVTGQYWHGRNIFCVSGSYFSHFSKSSIFSVRMEKPAEKWMGMQKSKFFCIHVNRLTFLYANSLFHTLIHFSAHVSY